MFSVIIHVMCVGHLMSFDSKTAFCRKGRCIQEWRIKPQEESCKRDNTRKEELMKNTTNLS